jgi:hypothetical protein
MAADSSLSSRARVVVERQRVSAREAAVVCRNLEAYLKSLLPKEHSKNLQVFVPVATKDDEGNTLHPMGKLAKDDDFLSVPVAKLKKVKKNGEKIEHHNSDIIEAFAMIKVALPLTRGDLPACLAQVAQAREAFEARAEARVEREDREAGAAAAGDAAEAPPVKSVECGPLSPKVAKVPSFPSCNHRHRVICNSPHWMVTLAVFVSTFFILLVVHPFLCLLGFGSFVHGLVVPIMSASMMTCMMLWAYNNGWLETELQGLTRSFFCLFGFEALVQRICSTP